MKKKSLDFAEITVIGFIVLVAVIGWAVIEVILWILSFVPLIWN
jgi:hypothetical protein